MVLATGLDAQAGMVEESTYGTYVAPTRFYEFNSESIAPVVAKLYSRPLGSGRIQRTSRRRTSVTGAGGDINIDAVNRGMGVLLKQMFGKVTSAQVGETAEYTQTYVPDPNGKRGLSATVQVGRPSTDGTIRPFSYVGGKVIGWSLAAALDDIVKINTTWDFKTQTTSEDVETASYADDVVPFTFLDGALSIGGSPVATIKAVNVAWAEAQDTARRYFGNQKGEPLPNGMLELTGQFDSEFNDMAAHDAWVAGDEIVDAVITFTGETIPEESNPYKIVLTIPSLEYTGSAPAIGGPEVVQQNLPWMGLFNGEEELITLVYHTDDTAI
ncbi:MAG: phage tail tube protein [Pigmentiphaga sp.]